MCWPYFSCSAQFLKLCRWSHEINMDGMKSKKGMIMFDLS